MPEIAFFECSRCNHRIEAASVAGTLQTLCPACAAPLYIRYDMRALRQRARREDIARSAAAAPGSPGIWRYGSVLPSGTLENPITPVTLGEGWTPLLRSRRSPGLYIKQEGTNPTGSWKARGLSLAVTMAQHAGLKHLATASAHEVAGELAAYAAAAGIAAHIYMPPGVSPEDYLGCIAHGADVHLVEGPHSDCEALLAEEITSQLAANLPEVDLWFDISDLKEPFLVEGMKTTGYELVEQLGWIYPDAVVCTIGSGAGILGMGKAFEELEALGWVEQGSKRPRIYAARAESWNSLATICEEQTPAIASIVLDIVDHSGGRVLAPAADEALAAMLDSSLNEGILFSPDGAAATAAYKQLFATGEIAPGDCVVVMDSTSGLRYTDSIAKTMHLRRPGTLPRSLPVGGIITPQ